MIRPLRQLHRRAFFALSILLPAALAVGIAARKPTPANAALLLREPHSYAKVEWDEYGLFDKSPIEVRLWRDEENSGAYGIAFDAPVDFLKPDLLVYWVAGKSKPDGPLPANAILLGALGGSPLPLPGETTNSPGAFVLYSVAAGEIVDECWGISLNQFLPAGP